jgi:hypothetical protein
MSIARPHNIHKAAYSVGEVIELLSLGRNAVFSLLSSGELKRIKVGRRTVVTAESIITFVDRKVAENAIAQPYGAALQRQTNAERRREAAAANASEAA